jgi:hypothetical protein
MNDKENLKRKPGAAFRNLLRIVNRQAKEGAKTVASDFYCFSKMLK